MTRFISALLLALVSLAASVQAGTLTFTTYYHNDHLGSPVAATDENNDLLWRAHFRPYGERQEDPAKSAFGTPGYTGHAQDKDSGLVYAGARYYEPMIGRFMAVDPVGLAPGSPGSFNRYAYANNNPYRYTDPDGRFPVDYLVDGLSIAASSAIYANDPSFSNGIALAADVVLAGMPYIPAGIGLVRGGDKLLDAKKTADGVGEVAKSTPSGGSPALKGDPYHPDSVAARQSDWQRTYGSFDPIAAAKDLGYGQRIPPQKAPFKSHGQPVFSNGKGYISPDVDGHNVTNGWKMFDQRGRRTGTWSSDLSKRLKD